MYDVNCNLVDTDMTLHVYIDLCQQATSTYTGTL